MRFTGEISGFGTTTGHRYVVGRWTESPFGPFTDVMHEDPEGVRTLLAPSAEIARFVADTYVFENVRVARVDCERGPNRLRVKADDLEMDVSIGGRTPLGWLLRAVPRPVARSTRWCTAIDPIARTFLRGVRTRGSAGGGRQEWYGATDIHRLSTLHAHRGGADLGQLAPVDPPVSFGFGSTPASPCIVEVVTTIAMAPSPG